MTINTLAAFDLDGTLLKKNSSFEFFQFLTKRGVFSFSDLSFCALIYYFHRYLGLSLWKLHSLVFKRLFYGLNLDMLRSHLTPFLEENLSLLWYQPAIRTLRNFQNQNIPCIILSNSPYFLVEAIGQKIGVNQVFGTEYSINEKGELWQIARLMDGLEKKRILENFSAYPSMLDQLSQTKTNSVVSANIRTIAFSDSSLDIPFLEAAHQAIAVNPQNRLKKYAKKKGWEIL